MEEVTKTREASAADIQPSQKQEQSPPKEKQNGRNHAGTATTQGQEKKKSRPRKRKHPNPTPRLSVSKEALKKLKLVAIAYSHVERDFFPTESAYEAEVEVEERSAQVLEEMTKLGINGKLYAADEHFLTNLLVDRPTMVLNLVDSLRGKDALSTSITGALEMVDIPYTGASMSGMLIGTDRNLFKQILQANNIPTPDYQYIQRVGTNVNPNLGVPLIVKLNESGGSVGIDNHAVKESVEAAQKQVDSLISTYHIPVIVEQFIDGPEITAVVFEDSRKRHVFLAQKEFKLKPDGKHEFTSRESYEDWYAYKYKPVEDQELAKKIEQYVSRAFSLLRHKDYSKFDIRVDEKTGTPFFTDGNPNTAFGPDIGLPMTDILKTLYGVKFEKVLASLLSKYAKKIKTNSS